MAYTPEQNLGKLQLSGTERQPSNMLAPLASSPYSWRRFYRRAYLDSYLDGDVVADRIEVVTLDLLLTAALNTLSVPLALAGQDVMGKATQPDTNYSTTTYNANGSEATTTSANGVTATYTYDSSSRVTQISYSDSTPTVTYS